MLEYSRLICILNIDYDTCVEYGASEIFLELATVDVGRADCVSAVGCDEAAKHFFIAKLGVNEGVKVR